VFERGERFPMLIDVDTGVPLFDQTVFTLTNIRTQNRASATIEVVLRALKVFQLFCDRHGIVMTQRMREGRLLDLGELDALASLCRLPICAIDGPSPRGPTRARPTAVRLERYRTRAREPDEEVTGDYAGVRLRYIRNYIRWLADRQLLSLSPRHPTRAALADARETTMARLSARVPIGKRRNGVHGREALDEKMQQRLWTVITADSPDNPWRGRHAMIRNELIVRWFIGLGIRRGELLGVKISDLNWRSLDVFIARRADDPDDPRPHQPNTKTRDRTLPLSIDLARRTHQYIMEERRRFPAARKHPFLFVANGGAPLSVRGLNEIFVVLAAAHPELTAISPHILRHTNNFNFSNLADEKGMDPIVETKTRAQMMGWSETSDAATHYPKR